MEDLRDRKQGIEDRIAAESLEFRRSLTMRNAGFREVSGAIGPGEAIVSFVVFRRLPLDARSGWWSGQDSLHYLAFAYRKDTHRSRIVPIADGAALDALVGDWSARQTTPPSLQPAAAGHPAGDGAGPGRALRETVWDPLQDAIAGAHKVLITPDGVLNAVNFYALPARSGGYLIESGPLMHYLSTERDLLGGTTPAPGGGLLAIGDVDYRAVGAATRMRGRDPVAQSCPGIRRTGLTPLPHTRAEVDFIAAEWRRFARPAPASWLILTKREATETAFKNLAPGRTVLHLAAHGFFLDATCPDRTRVRWRGIGGLAPASGTGGLPRDPWSPLLLSGVVLAGTNSGTRAAAGDDGFLTAEEISSLDLGAAEWVVLSACDTGRGTYQRGEGILGLRRAFHLAGARTLIMSLWPVEDEAASRWMMALYRGRLEKGLSTAEAVRAAGMEVLADRRARGLPDHPFFWAGWVAEGDWR
jgi:CHAT domain-containing protein